MKHIITVVIAALVVTLFGVQAFAATTASLTPSLSTISAGQTFTVSIALDPQASANYAEKLEIKFPADLLEVRGFSFGPSWMALSQPGYDVTDNVNGTLVKSAGYSSGFTTPTFYGTVTFYAKKAGTGAVAIGTNSAAFNANGQTVLSGQALALTIGAVQVQPVATVAPVAVPVKTVAPGVVGATTTDTEASSTLTAAAEGAETGMSTKLISLIVLAVIVIAGAVVLFIKRKSKTQIQ